MCVYLCTFVIVILYVIEKTNEYRWKLSQSYFIVVNTFVLIPNAFCLYSMMNKLPVLLTSFETGSVSYSSITIDVHTLAGPTQ